MTMGVERGPRRAGCPSLGAWFDQVRGGAVSSRRSARSGRGRIGRPAGSHALRPVAPARHVALLVGVNVLNNAAAPDLYLLWACVAIVGLALLARADGLPRHDWGLGPVTGRAARATAVLVGVTAIVMLVGTQLPGVATAYQDERVAGMGAGEVAFAALVRVPVGTALLEEVAFRGVLLAMLTRRYGTAWGVAGSSVAFGAWHLLPSLDLSAGNAAIGRRSEPITWPRP